MADVFRGKYRAQSGSAFFGYAFHGVTAILTLWLVAKRWEFDGGYEMTIALHIGGIVSCC